MQGLDYPGNDIYQINRANYQDCCNDCSVVRGCVAYVWTSWNGGTCFLKSSLGDPTPYEGAVSAVAIATASPPTTPPSPASQCAKSIDNVDYPGNDIGQTNR
ncbi:unnamed protein product, partial [Aphanomyces euteiches]